MNTASTTYYWVAFRASPGEVLVGSYTGDGNDNRNITGLGFSPQVTFIMSAGASAAVFKTPNMGGDSAMQFDTGTALGVANLIQSMTIGGGFQIGNDARVNTAGTVYHYVVWASVTGKFVSGMYTGNGTSQPITASLSGATPAWVLVRRWANTATSPTATKPASAPVTTSLFTTATAANTTTITALGANSFTVGADASVNNGTNNQNTYMWFAVAQPNATACGTVNDVTYLAATASSTKATVHWAGTNGVLILRKAGSAPSETPTNGIYYVRGDQPWGGSGSTVVYTTASASESSMNDGGLTNGTAYYYKVFSKSTLECYSAGLSVSTTPQASPAGNWVYTQATPAGSILNAGIAGNGSIYTSSNGNRIIGLDTATGMPSWKAVPTTGAVQGWLTWLPASTADFTSGLVGYWKLDDGAGTSAADSSGNARTGTLSPTGCTAAPASSGTPTWTSSGRLGGALSLNGTGNCVSIPHNAAFNAYPITVTAWFKMPTPGTQSTGIVSKRASGSVDGWDLYASGGNATTPSRLWGVYYANGISNVAQVGPNYYVSGDGVWHHAAMVVDANGMTMYGDGVVVATAAWGGTKGATTSTGEVRIGSMPTSTSGFFPGLVDEVRIYNRALTAGQVGALYNATATNYAYHRTIAVTTGSAGTPAGYSASLTFDHASLVSATPTSKSRADGNDVRVYYVTSGNTLLELDRVLDPGSSWNTSSTKIWFKTQAAVPANSIDDNYILYYGDASVTSALADPTSIFLFFDDFESGTLSKWTTLPASGTLWANASGMNHSAGGNRAANHPAQTASLAFLDASPVLNEANIYVDSWWRVDQTASNDIAQQVRRVGETTTSTVDRYETNLINATGWDISKTVAGTTTTISASTSSPAVNTWTRIGTAIYNNGTSSYTRVFKDGVQINPASGNTDVGSQIVAGNVGFNKNITGGNWWIDDVIVRRYVDPEPTTSLGLEQSGSWGGLFGGDQSGYVYSLDSASGTQNWTGNLSAKANGIQAAVSAQLWQYSNAAFKAQFSGDVIFGGSRNTGAAGCTGANNTAQTSNKVFAINVTDGTMPWTFNDLPCNTAMDYIAGQPWVDYDNNRLFVTSGPGAGSQPTLWVLNSLNGSLLGSLSNMGAVDSSPTLIGNTLYVASSGAGTLCVSPSSSCLYAIDVTPATVAGWPTNAVKWSVSLGAFAVRGFVWDSGGGTLYFATTDGNVWCVKQSDGTGCSGWPAGGKVQVGASGTPIPLDYLYVGSSTDFKIHQLNPGTGADMKQYPASAALDGTATLGALSTETGTELFFGTSAGRVFKIPLSSGLP